jgi:hypothetical protein
MLKEVLQWDNVTNNYAWKNGVRLPAVTVVGKRVGKSLQVWIARHQALLES